MGVIIPGIGSPPRLRGLLSFSSLKNSLTRITPALAGTTMLISCQILHHQDHPRACGDYVRCFQMWIALLGSPPRLRGPLVNLLPTSPFVRDHPRACGDYIWKISFFFTLGGSPPRLRGLQLGILEDSYSRGITPALAGTTHWESKNRKMHQDHPRACGDYVWSPYPVTLNKGSPPRLRGLPFQ